MQSLIAKSHIRKFILAIICLIILPVNSELAAEDKSAAYTFTLTARSKMGRTLYLDIKVGVVNPKTTKQPQTLDQLKLKFYGINGAVVHTEIITELGLGRRLQKENAILWQIKVESSDAYGSVEGKVMFATPNGEVQLRSDSYISGYQMIPQVIGRAIKNDKKTNTANSIAISVSIAIYSSKKEYTLPESLDKAQIKIFDKNGKLMRTENYFDLTVKYDYARKLYAARIKTFYVDVTANSYELDVHMLTDSGKLLLSDAGDICYNYYCENNTTIIIIREEVPVNELRKNIAVSDALPRLPDLGAYPNPFNPTTTIHYSLDESQSVSLIIYDMLGNEISHLVSGHQIAGDYSVLWNGRNLNGLPAASGMYIVRLVTPNFTKSMKAVLLK